MLKTGITGQQGFIGTALYRFLDEEAPDVKLIPWRKDYFNSPQALNAFVAECDVIVHLAGMSRHEDEELLYKVNMELVDKLLEAAGTCSKPPHIIFASTTHEPKGNRYHCSKRDGRLKIDAWAKDRNAKATAIMTPNTYGPGAKPFFNSFVSTFCHQVATGESPQVIEDAEVELIYIEDLCREIYRVIKGDITENPYKPRGGVTVKVSEVLELLWAFEDDGTMPADGFPRKLYETYHSYMS
jgi:UDP-2-acetamido-2,6-beta-L-arabino-hexul-4-ose reductase